MPRSFLVKKHSSHKKPNYGELETQKDTSSPQSCSGLVLPLILQQEVIPPISIDPAKLWDRGSVIARLSLPLLQDNEIKIAPITSHPDLQINLIDTLTTKAPSNPLRENLKTCSIASFINSKRPPSLLCNTNIQDTILSVESGTMEALEKFECFDCHKSYHTFSGLAKHRQLHCNLQSRKYFNCKYCDKEYVSLGALKMHIRTHTLPCVCKICGKAFSRPWLLQGHIRTHTGEKPFACSHCSRAFADRSNLRAHLQTHSDVKKYQCKSCSKTFSRMSLLCKHEEAGCCPCSTSQSMVF
ncbi:zinc finger protein SNAI3 [Latimeria chalumnae]|uniref:zinc finger protein SNAI3 n=1 Tax=Latimeria chalumnae TaxID=7897 RepID=UPI0003C11701